MGTQYQAGMECSRQQAGSRQYHPLVRLFHWSSSMPLGVGVVGILRERGDREALFAEHCVGVGAPCVRGSYWCSCFKVALERAGVQSNYPHRKQSHQQLCQQYRNRDGSLDHNSCRICSLRCFPCMQRVRIASRRWHRSTGSTAPVYGVGCCAGVGQS